MKTLKLTITVLILAFSSVAMSQGGPQVTIYEVLLGNFGMAESSSGSVGFKECDECEYQLLRVTDRSTFMIDGQAMRFKDFREAIIRFESEGENEININVGRDDRSGTLATIFIYTQ